MLIAEIHMNVSEKQTQFVKFSRSEVWLLFAGGIAVLLSRMPWLTAGPGMDPDSYRVFNVAKSIADTGSYSASRLPGYPAYEYLVTALVNLGPAATNLLSTLFSVCAFVLLALILRKSGIRPYLAGAIAFAFTPVVYINSVSTIDYIPAVTLILAATYFVLDRRFIVAGLCLGIAVGMRITSGAMLVPLIFWLVLSMDRESAVRSCVQLISTTLVTAIICFIPVFYKYGLGFFTFTDFSGYPSFTKIFMVGIFWVWGSVGIIALTGLCAFTPLYINRNRTILAERQTLALIVLAIVSVVMYVAAFLRLPAESGYLIPLIPFVIMFFGLVLPANFIRAFAVILVVSSFVSIGKTGVSMEGPVLSDNRSRVSKQQYARAVIKAFDKLPSSAIAIVGWELPSIKTELLSSGRDAERFIYKIDDQKKCMKYRNEGRTIFFLPGLDEYHKKFYGVDLRQCGSQQPEQDK